MTAKNYKEAVLFHLFPHNDYYMSLRLNQVTASELELDQRIIDVLPPTSPLTVCARPFPNARPIPNSYWAIPNSLLACEYPWTPKNPKRPKLDALLRAGVRTFIDLTECGELLSYADLLCERATKLGIDPSSVQYHRFPIRDRSLPQSVDYMYDVLDVLQENKAQGRICAVHCRGGIGRTGMVIGCWLVQSGLAKDGEEALQIIAKEWATVEKCHRYPHSPETGPQFEFVKSFLARKTPRSVNA